MRKFYFLAVIILFTGCGSSSPRFGASEAKSKTHHVKKAAPRFSSPEAREEAAEDDVKVDAKQVAGKLKSSSRSAKKRTSRASSSPKSVAVAQTAGGADEAAEADVRETAPATADTSASSAIDQQKMMETIAQWLETPYSYGADGGEESGIDCSAFTREVFEEAASITLPRSSAEQAQVGEKVDRSELKFGDLVFFKTNGHGISHVGIYIGDDLFAHASSGSGVTISSLDSTYFNKRYAAARRVRK